jgi:hypothetical protein
MISHMHYTLLGVSVAVVLFLGMLVLLELGRRVGQRRLAADTEAAGVGVIDGAVFALLGLLLAFTFSGAAARFETRRSLVVEEANAIGTAYLRLDLLPPDAQPPLREKFRRYVETRLEAYRAMPDVWAARAELAKAAALQGEIWSQAVAATSSERYQPTRVVVLPAINAMIDITTTRTVAAQAHPPMVIFSMLVLVAMVSSLLAGNAVAAKKSRPWLHMLGFAAATALAVFVILDLEFPRIGLIRLDAFDKVLVDVMESMK